MKRIHVRLIKHLFLLCGALNFSAALFAAETEAPPGYTDTPKLPHVAWRVHDQVRPQPVKVVPGRGDLGATPPADAIVLFDGTDLKHWRSGCMCGTCRWGGQITDAKKHKYRPGKKNVPEAVENGVFDIQKTGQLETTEEFGSCQIHLEWATSPTPQGRMDWGNSGVFFLGAIEVQIIESHDSFIYADGNAGAIYGQYPPLVNASRKSGEWQSFDIVFTAPKIKDGVQTEPARLTVFHNGVLVQNNVAVLGATKHRSLPVKLKRDRGRIVLQEHSSSVKFRNIWIRPLDDAPKSEQQ